MYSLNLIFLKYWQDIKINISATLPYLIFSFWHPPHSRRKTLKAVYHLRLITLCNMQKANRRTATRGACENAKLSMSYVWRYHKIWQASSRFPIFRVENANVSSLCGSGSGSGSAHLRKAPRLLGLTLKVSVFELNAYTGRKVCWKYSKYISKLNEIIRKYIKINLIVERALSFFYMLTYIDSLIYYKYYLLFFNCN